MKGKAVTGIMSALLLIGILTLAFNVQPVKSDWTSTEPIYIRADGSVDPSTAPISTVDQITYTLTDNIVSDVPYHVGAIIVERDNIVVDGAGYTVESVTTAAHGLDLSGRSNVMVTNMRFEELETAILLDESDNNIICGNYFPVYIDDSAVWLIDSDNNIISGNTIIDIVDGNGIDLYNSFDNIITGNTITFTGWYGGGIGLRYSSSGNIVTGNTITDCPNWGIKLEDTSDNTITENNIEDNACGIWLKDSSDNSIYHNNFIGNTEQVHIESYPNEWDDGYPSGGNYWDDYTDVDEKSGPNQDLPGSDGIWDNPKVLDANNKDNYPLVELWTPLPRTMDELKTKIEEFGSEGEIANQGVVKNLIAKLNLAQRLIEKSRINEARRVLEIFILQVQELSGILITVEAARNLIISAEYLLSQQ